MVNTEMKLTQELNTPNSHYNTLIKFLPNFTMWEYISKHDPEWQPKHKGTSFSQKETCHKVMLLIKAGYPLPVKPTQQEMLAIFEMDKV